MFDQLAGWQEVFEWMMCVNQKVVVVAGCIGWTQEPGPEKAENKKIS